MHPIPTALRHPCSPRCPPHPHFLALCGAPQSTPQPPTDFCAARGAPLSADHELGLCRGLLFTNHRMLQSNKGVLSFLFVVFQMADVPRGGRRHEPRGPRAASADVHFFRLFASVSALRESKYVKVTNPRVRAHPRRPHAAPAVMHTGPTHAKKWPQARTAAHAPCGPNRPLMILSACASAQTQRAATEPPAVVLRDVALACCR